jgi:ribonuclease P protein component
MSKFSFNRKERIKKRADFLSIYKNGQNFETRHFRITVMANKREFRRLGLSVSKKTGGAVQRNYVKRRLREYFRLNKELFPINSDMIITVKHGAADKSYNDMKSELNNLLPI